MKSKKMEENKLKKVIISYLNNELDDRGNNGILNWVNQSEANKKKFRELHIAYHATKVKDINSKINVDSAWNTLKRQLSKSNHKKFNPTNWILKNAASVAILIGLSLATYIIWDKGFNGIDSTVVKLEVPKGEKSKFILADGTQVWLNSESELIYNTKRSREIFISGEAFFDVVHNQKKPFVVTTLSKMKVNVLGTSFNLRAYNDEPYIETTLEQGKVDIISAKNRILAKLHSGEQAIYTVKQAEIQKKKVDVKRYLAWKNNVLRFDDLPFQECAKRMERWYGVKIEFDPKLNISNRFTMTIKTQSLKELLDMMQYTANFNYNIKGEHVSIIAK